MDAFGRYNRLRLPSPADYKSLRPNRLGTKFTFLSYRAVFIMRNNLFELTIIALLASITAQEFGQRIGRRGRQNFGIKSVSHSPVVTPVRAEPIKPKVAEPLRIGRTNLGYSYLVPDNPLLLPSSSNQDVQHHHSSAIKSQPSQVVQQDQQQIQQQTQLEELPWVEVVDIQQLSQQQPEQEPDKQILIPAAQNLAPVQQSVDDEIAFWDFRESIPGDPEFDYPILDKIPTTSFRCNGQLDGYYADVETRCQVFHVCTSIPNAEPIKASFLCPNGTLFNQENFVCQWWPDVDCPTSPQFYELNKNIGVVPESSKHHNTQLVPDLAHLNGATHQN